jgi:hypothetical protein
MTMMAIIITMTTFGLKLHELLQLYSIIASISLGSATYRSTDGRHREQIYSAELTGISLRLAPS